MNLVPLTNSPVAANPWLSPKAERRRQVAQLVSSFCHRWFNSEGEWIDAAQEPDTRTKIWLCFGLFRGGPADVALANAILWKVHFEMHGGSGRTNEESRSHFDIFITNNCLQMLVLHASRMSPRVKEKMDTWAKACLGDYPGDRQSDYQFHGFNDNMPSKATFGMIVGGEYFGDNAAVGHGLWNLHQLRYLLCRRGLISEYTSPTYSPLTLLSLTEIIHHAANEEARELASLCAERLWADILGHYHAPTGLMGGPYSRAYHMDSAAHISAMSNLLWLVRGEDGVIPNPLEELRAEPVRLMHPGLRHPVLKRSHHAEALSTLAWIASTELCPPDYLTDWERSRTYPFSLRATAERGGDGDSGSQGGEIVTTHYQEENFALGTAEGEIWTQADTFLLQYRRRVPARTIEDIRTVYTRYFINEHAPYDGQVLPSYGIAHVLQDRRIVMMLARPQLELAGKEIDSLKLSLIFPTHFGELDRVEIRDGHIFVHDGPIYFGLRPLNVMRWEDTEAVRLEKVDSFQLISLYNYQGAARKFTRQELVQSLNGFVAVVGLSNEETFDQFSRRVLAAEYVDYWHHGSRNVRYRLGETLLEIDNAVESNRVRFACINGSLLSRPVWEADGLPAGRLPFLDGPPKPMTMEIPFTHLRKIWAPDSPWIIASRGGAKKLEEEL